MPSRIWIDTDAARGAGPAIDPDASQLFNGATASAWIAVDHRLSSDWFYSPTRCSSDPRRNSQRLRAPAGR